jgi:hypothetical protein
LQAADITNIDEEEVLSKLANMKVDTLNTETSEKASLIRGENLIIVFVPILKNKYCNISTIVNAWG